MIMSSVPCVQPWANCEETWMTNPFINGENQDEKTNGQKSIVSASFCMSVRAGALRV